ncbi:cell division cycle 20.3, cofactor of APC complex-like [Patiria miniata]|uniref:Uncharacterized protein n=1 Tax=Patiria miniata TaxID=46514 RepID=A0A913Z9K2_PATMI|nr:cell division cycle 20.3, cofactor of APC complex-like [Patiria miniata]
MIGAHHHDQQRRARAGSFDRFIPVRDGASLAAASFKFSSRRSDDVGATSAQDVFDGSAGEAGEANNNDSPYKQYRESSSDYLQRMTLLTDRVTEDSILSFRPRQRSGSWSGYRDAETSKQPCRQLPSSPAQTFYVTGLNGTSDECSRLFDINCHGQLAIPQGDAIHIKELTRPDQTFEPFSLHITKPITGRDAGQLHRQRRWCVQWSSTGHTLAVGGPALMLIDATLGDVTASIMTSSPPSCLDWSRHCLSAGFLDGAVQAYDTRIGLCTVGSFICTSRHSSPITTLRYSVDGGLLACGTADGKLVIWDTRQRQKPQHEMEAHSDGVGAMAWCPWKPWYVTTGGKASDQTIRTWNAYSGVMSKNLMVGSEVTSLAWYEQSSELVSSHANPSGEANIRVWKSPKMRMIVELKRHEGPVLQVGLTPGGDKLASVGSEDPVMLCIWDFSTGYPLSPQGASSHPRRRSSTFNSPGKSPGPIASPLALGGIR